MFEKNSRYSGMETYEVTDSRGRRVPVVRIPPAPVEQPLGEHLLQQGQRLDHLAFRYLSDATTFWRICELNEVVHADALAEAQAVRIPRRRS